MHVAFGAPPRIPRDGRTCRAIAVDARAASPDDADDLMMHMLVVRVYWHADDVPAPQVERGEPFVCRLSVRLNEVRSIASEDGA